MRKTKVALTFGILALATYGCGDSDSKVTKKDGAAGAETGTTTKYDASSSTGTNTSTATNTSTSTATMTTTGVDAGIGIDGPAVTPDAPVTNPLDGGIGVDGPAVVVAVDGGKLIDGGGVAVDGGATKDAPVQTDGTTSAGKCNYPQCYLDIAKGCMPEGACVQQEQGFDMTTMSMSTNICYSNGVKIITAINASNPLTPTMTETWKKDSAVCYTLEAIVSSTAIDNITLTMKNAGGATVATVTRSSTANATTITCTGAAPVTVPDDCEDTPSTDGGSSGDSCSPGTCSP